VANVIINSVRLLPGTTDNKAMITALQDGKWDAACSVLGTPEIGFDSADSPSIVTTAVLGRFAPAGIESEIHP
jgi:hypothetical protein